MGKTQTQRTSKPVIEATKKTCKNPGEIDPSNIVAQPRVRKNIDYKAMEAKGRVVKVKRESNNISEKRSEKKQPEKVAKVTKQGLGESVLFPSKKSMEGTSYHGSTIMCSAADLIKLFPNARVHICTDSNYEFVLETKQGDVVTIYDHGLDGQKLPRNEKWVFNIGGFSKEITSKATEEVNKLLKTLKTK